MAGRTRRFRPWQVVLFALLGVVVLAAVDLGVQELYHRYVRPLPSASVSNPAPSPPVSPLPATPLPTPWPSPTSPENASPHPTPSPEPVVTVVPTLVTVPPIIFDDEVTEGLWRSNLLRQLLLKAAMELLRTEDYLASGETKQVERELVAISATLEQAANAADESLRATIEDLQRDVSRLREDLYLRPERLRDGVRRLWQRVDVLISE